VAKENPTCITHWVTKALAYVFISRLAFRATSCASYYLFIASYSPQFVGSIGRFAEQNENQVFLGLFEIFLYFRANSLPKRLGKLIMALFLWLVKG
jgi:hypothetical protein